MSVGDISDTFTELVETIGTGEYEYVVVWEISRLARLGSIYQRFFEACEDAGTTVVITDGWVEEVRRTGPGSSSPTLAQRSLRRSAAASSSARRPASSARKRRANWLGNVPKGFVRDDDGYLQPIPDPDRESGEVGYLEVHSALTRVNAGESYRSVANDIPNLS